MNERTLLFLSLALSSVALLYLLIANLVRGSFMLTDWVIVSMDLAIKVMIELYILIRKSKPTQP